MKQPKVTGQTKSQGFVLITVLAFVVVLTLVALMAMPTQMVQIKNASGSANARIAFETAEATLSIASNQVFAGTYSGFENNSGGLYLQPRPDGNTVSRWQSVSWTNADSLSANFAGGSRESGRFIIEQLPSVMVAGESLSTRNTKKVYRITARAVGADGEAPVILQTVVVGN